MALACKVGDFIYVKEHGTFAHKGIYVKVTQIDSDGWEGLIYWNNDPIMPNFAQGDNYFHAEGWEKDWINVTPQAGQIWSDGDHQVELASDMNDKEQVKIKSTGKYVHVFFLFQHYHLLTLKIETNSANYTQGYLEGHNGLRWL